MIGFVVISILKLCANKNQQRSKLLFTRRKKLGRHNDVVAFLQLHIEGNKKLIPDYGGLLVFVSLDLEPLYVWPNFLLVGKEDRDFRRRTRRV